MKKKETEDLKKWVTKRLDELHNKYNPKEKKKRRKEINTKIDLCLGSFGTILFGSLTIWFVYKFMIILSKLVQVPEEKFTNRLVFLGIIFIWIAYKVLIISVDYFGKSLDLLIKTLKKFKLKDGEKK